MIAIGKKEFVDMFKSIKSLIIIALLLVTSYFSAKYSDILGTATALTEQEMKDAYTVGLVFLLIFFGQLFVTSISHDTINKESHERTMRFLVTRTSRGQILFGKFSGVWLFWFSCIFVSFLLISIFSSQFHFLIFSQAIALLTYQISLTVLLSVVIHKPSITMFLGVVIGLLYPIFNFWLMLSTNSWFSWLKFASPYYYLMETDYLFLVVFVFSAMTLAIALLVFNRREF